MDDEHLELVLDAINDGKLDYCPKLDERTLGNVVYGLKYRFLDLGGRTSVELKEGEKGIIQRVELYANTDFIVIDEEERVLLKKDVPKLSFLEKCNNDQLKRLAKDYELPFAELSQIRFFEGYLSHKYTKLSYRAITNSLF